MLERGQVFVGVGRGTGRARHIGVTLALREGQDAPERADVDHPPAPGLAQEAPQVLAEVEAVARPSKIPLREVDEKANPVEGRSYDEVWAAAERAMRTQLKPIDADKTKGVIRGAELNFVGAPNAFVGIWITPVTSTASAYTVQTNQNLRNKACRAQTRHVEERQAGRGGTR